MLELEVAVLVFGIALIGVFPLSVMYSRQLKRFETRFDSDTTYYLIPRSDRWAQKLGAAATLATDDAGAGSGGISIPAYEVQILSIDKSLTGETITVTASVATSGS